jgi:hypothetical protein
MTLSQLQKWHQASMKGFTGSLRALKILWFIFTFRDLDLQILLNPDQKTLTGTEPTYFDK